MNIKNKLLFKSIEYNEWCLFAGLPYLVYLFTDAGGCRTRQPVNPTSPEQSRCGRDYLEASAICDIRWLSASLNR